MLRLPAKPSGVGAPLNIYMFTPRAVARHISLLCSEPRYFRARLRVLLYQQLHPYAPWLTADAIELLQRYLKPSMTGFEWGSGRSTVWLSKRLRSLVSVEHDPIWFQRVSKWLRRAHVNNVDYRLLPTRPDNRYVAAICDFPEESFDFILVDGQCRSECLAAAVPKVKRDGLIVLDNADEGYEAPAGAALTRISTDNQVWRTDILAKRYRSSS
jgi:predicted O-methyltransferase YrrM